MNKMGYVYIVLVVIAGSTLEAITWLPVVGIAAGATYVITRYYVTKELEKESEEHEFHM